MRYFKALILSTIIIAGFTLINQVQAETAEEIMVKYQPTVNSVIITAEQASSGYNFKTDDSLFVLGFLPNTFKDTAEIRILKFNQTTDLKIFDDKQIASNVYQFDLINREAYNPNKPVIFQITTLTAGTKNRAVYVFNETDSTWNKIKTANLDNQIFSGKFKQASARIVVLEDKEDGYGIASWYKYKNCDCAASHDYPKGTKLKVTNTVNGKSLVVRVNDYGPEEWTKRIIDLDKTAFAKIAKLGAGLARVKVEPYLGNQ